MQSGPWDFDYYPLTRFLRRDEKFMRPRTRVATLPGVGLFSSRAEVLNIDALYLSVVIPT